MHVALARSPVPAMGKEQLEALEKHWRIGPSCHHMSPNKHQDISRSWTTLENLAVMTGLATGNGNGHLKRDQRAGIGQIFATDQGLTGEVQHWSKFVKDLAGKKTMRRCAAKIGI